MDALCLCWIQPRTKKKETINEDGRGEEEEGTFSRDKIRPSYQRRSDDTGLEEWSRNCIIDVFATRDTTGIWPEHRFAIKPLMWTSKLVVRPPPSILLVITLPSKSHETHEKDDTEKSEESDDVWKRNNYFRVERYSIKKNWILLLIIALLIIFLFF